MTCSNCGTDIADKAIVCYRCGQPTVAAKRQPAPPPSRGRGLLVTLAFAALVLAALFLGQAGTYTVPPAVSWAVAAIAAAVVIWRLVARRR
jgi:hypothetical protein